MTKANIPQYSATAASNTDVQDIDIAENCAPSGINNAIREIMADLKDQDTGAVAMTSPVATSLTVTNEITANGGIALGDNDKATFGAGDLQIYHNANNSFIQDVGTGSLYIDGSASVNIRETSTNAPMAVLTGSGSVDLYHNGIKKIATTTTGIDVTGIVDASDLVRFGVNNSEIANNYVRFKPTGAAYIDHSVVGQNINFRLSNASMSMPTWNWLRSIEPMAGRSTHDAS